MSGISRMTKNRKPNLTMQSFLDSHDHPFVLIDESYTIIGANQAYYDYYNTSADRVLDAKCHMIQHGSELPCHCFGEKCPLQMIMESSSKCETYHLHYNRDFYVECVIVKGYPITDENGNRYIGEELIGEDVMKSDIKKYATGDNPVQSIEAWYIAQLLEEHHGDHHKVADILKISERMLNRKIRNYDLMNVGRTPDTDNPADS